MGEKEKAKNVKNPGAAGRIRALIRDADLAEEEWTSMEEDLRVLQERLSRVRTLDSRFSPVKFSPQVRELLSQLRGSHKEMNKEFSVSSLGNRS